MDGVDREPWEIERVMTGSRVAQNNGIVLDRGLLHASAGTSRGNNTFHRVEEETVHFQE